MLYLFSDGYSDQFGGPKEKKTQKNFTKMLCDISELPMLVQKEKLETFFEDWRGDLEQVDDVSIVGIRIV